MAKWYGKSRRAPVRCKLTGADSPRPVSVTIAPARTGPHYTAKAEAVLAKLRERDAAARELQRIVNRVVKARRISSAAEREEVAGVGMVAALEASKQFNGHGERDAFIGQRVKWAVSNYLKTRGCPERRGNSAGAGGIVGRPAKAPAGIDSLDAPRVAADADESPTAGEGMQYGLGEHGGAFDPPDWKTDREQSLSMRDFVGLLVDTLTDPAERNLAQYLLRNRYDFDKPKSRDSVRVLRNYAAEEIPPPSDATMRRRVRAIEDKLRPHVRQYVEPTHGGARSGWAHGLESLPREYLAAEQLLRVLRQAGLKL